MSNRSDLSVNCSCSDARRKGPDGVLLRLSFLVFVAFFAILMAASANDKSDVVTTVKNFVDGFNKGDEKAIAATCADQASIIDEFPPYQWGGSGACAKWTADYESDAKKNGITDGVVILGTPRHVEVTGDRAYVVVPANYKFKQNGKAIQEIGSTLTIALQKTKAGWQMTGWTWAKH